MKRRKIAGMRLGERLQLFTVEDSLLGRRFAYILKNLMVVVCVCLVIYVGYLVLQTLGVINITAGKDEIQAVAAMQGEVNNTLTNRTNNPKDILDILIGLVTVFVTAVTASQVYMIKILTIWR